MSDLVAYVRGLAPAFKERNDYQLSCEREFHFAVQAIERNDYLANIAKKNPSSLRDAILNVAAIGISLNPAEAHACLVPRDGRVCLDMYFRGLVKLATDSGAIKMAKPELVCDVDEEFSWSNPFTLPVHKFDPFAKERGSENIWGHLRGGYVAAMLPSGQYILDHMSAGEILQVKAASPSSSKAGSPWNKWPLEMIKKTLIKRAAKSWPQTTRLAEAIEVDNQTSVITFDQHEEPDSPERKDMLAIVDKLCEQKGIPHKELCRIAGLKSLVEIADDRLPRLIAWLDKQQDAETVETEETEA
jgi:recombinational DNA repair protein RecT